MINTIINGDCLEVMKNIKDKSIDMILCDLPYGTTGIKWDVIIPFDLLWEQYERIIKDNGAIVLTASQPFTTKLIASNYKMFRYEWIWIKNNSTGFVNAKKMPLKKHENILVFYKKSPTYNPQNLIELKTPKKFKAVSSDCMTGKHTTRYENEIIFKNGNTKEKGTKLTSCLSVNFKNEEYIQINTNYPNSILYFNIPSPKTRIHPTEKPLDLWEYLIKTYTNEGMTVLDNCSGSGVTAIAAINTNRNFICIEKDETYFNKSLIRLQNHLKNSF